MLCGEICSCTYFSIFVFSVCLVSGDSDVNKTRVIRYAQYIRNIFPSNDINILELASKTMGRIAVSLGIKRAEFLESEIKRAFEWLAEERSESKRLSACFILRELAIAMPTYFFQHINGFFNYIMLALRDPKEQIREAAAKAIRAAFVVTSKREIPEQSNKAHWYIQSYEEAIAAFADQIARERILSRDDHVHGALLILNELLRCSNASWEKKYTKLMQKLDSEQEILDEMANFNPIGHLSGYHSYSDDKIQSVNITESSICKKLMAEKYEKISVGKFLNSICLKLSHCPCPPAPFNFWQGSFILYFNLHLL